MYINALYCELATLYGGLWLAVAVDATEELLDLVLDVDKFSLGLRHESASPRASNYLAHRSLYLFIIYRCGKDKTC